MLHGRSVQALGQLDHRGLARGAVVGVDAHLDEPVGPQCRIGLADDGFGQAVGADLDDRVEVMGGGAVFLALGRSQGQHRHARIIGAR